MELAAGQTAMIVETGVTDTLDIALLHRPGETTPTGIKHERYSVDFLVNGVSLFEATKAAMEAGATRTGEMAGCFWVSGDNASIKAHNQALAEEFTFARPTAIREMDGCIERHRVMLFVCPACGDLGCGAITADIERDGDLVVWSRFGYQNDWQNEDGTNWDDFESYKSTGPFRFAWDAYKEVIYRAAEA
jgi:hypothetical protein